MSNCVPGTGLGSKVSAIEGLNDSGDAKAAGIQLERVLLTDQAQNMGISNQRDDVSGSY